MSSQTEPLLRSRSQQKSDATKTVAIVGAGVAGLVCARELKRAGFNVKLFEASDGVGGRVRTDLVKLGGSVKSSWSSSDVSSDRFLLDRGFQILIEAYPEINRQLNLRALELKGFAPGAVLASGEGKLRIVADPIRSPRYIFNTLVAGIAGFGDLVSLLLLRAKQLFLESPYTALQHRSSVPGSDGKSRPATNTEDFLYKDLKLSHNIVTHFLAPFFEAIYVTPLKDQVSSTFEFVLRMLAQGRACLPRQGMQAIPHQLAEGLDIQLGCFVKEVQTTAVQFVDDTVHYFDAVVVATDWPAACKLLPELPPAQGTSSTTWYFSLPSPPPVKHPLIVLNCTPQGPESASCAPRLVNVGFPSVVQRSYAPEGLELAAVTIRGDCTPSFGEDWVRKELCNLFGLQSLPEWKLLHVYNLGFHQPIQQPRILWPPRSPLCSQSGVYVCGDHCAEPTLDSAFRSGRYAAESIIGNLKPFQRSSR